jgi:nicotinamide-nucleotide amidase
MENEVERLVAELGKKLQSRKISIVVAESCTGGGLAHAISLCPGCSSTLERGYVVYSNKSKEELLKVKPFTLQTYGAVSKETAQEMAEGALSHSAAQVSVAITGIAGADAGHNREGIVWISCAGINKSTETVMRTLPGDRKKFCNDVMIEALNLLIDYVV